MEQTLMELVGERSEIMELINDPEVDQQTVLDTLDSIDGAIEVKANGYGMVLRGIKYERAGLNAKREYLQSLLDEVNKTDSRLASHEEAMKDRFMAAMIAIGKDDKDGIKTDDFEFKVVNCGGVPKLEKTGEVPDNFKKITYSDDDAKIKEYLKDHTVSWARILPKKRRLSIKGV